jgi:hypothetical protein
VRGDVRDGPGLARSVGGIPCCSTQVSGRAHRMATRGASLHHLDLATHPGADMLDRLTRSRVLGLSRLEKVKNVLCARCRPQSEEMVIRVGEGPTAADRHETRVSDLREDHGRNFYHLHPPNTVGRRARNQTRPRAKPLNPVVGPARDGCIVRPAGTRRELLALGLWVR